MDCSHGGIALAEAGLQSFTAVFDVADQPHWLKCFILRFSVLIAAKLDDSTGPACGNPSSDRHTDSSQSSMAPTQQPSGAAAQLSSANGQPIAKGERVGERGPQAADWLPPALLPPKPDGTAAGGKQKQPKKRAKQRAGGPLQPAPAMQSTSSSAGSWEIAAAQNGGSREHHGNGCMSDSSVDMSPAARSGTPVQQNGEPAGVNGLSNGHGDKAPTAAAPQGEAQQSAAAGVAMDPY